MALDLVTAYSIVNAVRTDVACRATIEGPRRSRVVMEMLGLWHAAGGVRNAVMMVKGLGREDDAFVRFSCIGIAQVTQRVIFSEILGGGLPKVQSSLVRRRNVNGYEHKGTGVVMKDGSDYVFDWWPTLTAGNPLISTLAQWANGGTTVEYEEFKESSMSVTHPNRSKLDDVLRSVLRVALVLVATVSVVVLGTLAFKWKEFKLAGAPTTKSNVLMLQAAVLQLWADGFAGCPTVQQVLELNLEPLESELQKETTGVDPWGTPYRIQCDRDHVLVFSLGPDKRAGTADDIKSIL